MYVYNEHFYKTAEAGLRAMQQEAEQFFGKHKNFHTKAIKINDGEKYQLQTFVTYITTNGRREYHKYTRTLYKIL